MEIKKEQLEELRNNPLMRFIADLCGQDLDELINEALKNEEKPKNVKITTDDIENSLKKAGFININDVVEQEKKQYEAPKCEVHKFVMTKSQFTQFCSTYSALLNCIKRLEYMYGISFDVPSNNGKTLSGFVRDIIWNFVIIIFGDDNADTIADYLYGNSNFDSAEKLYDELV